MEPTNQLQKMAAYIAENNPKGVNKLAYKHGYLPPVTQDGREGLIYVGMQEEGEEFLRDLASIHPDRDLIIQSGVSNADGSMNQTSEPNIIDLKEETKVAAIIKDNSDTINFIIILVAAYILYKILK